MSHQHFDDYLLYQLAMVSNVLSNEFHHELAGHNISPAEWRILYCLWSRPDMRLTELARHVLFKQPRVTKNVAQLERDGLIKKNINNRDRRNVYLCLTQKGKVLVLPLIKKAQEHEKKVLSTFPEKDRIQFRKSLSDLIESMSQNRV